MRIALLVGFLPALAFGQTLSLQVQGQNSLVISTGNCGQTAQVTWTLTAAGGIACSPGFQVWATAANCGDNPGTGDLTIVSPTTTPSSTGTANLDINSLPIFDGGTCGAAVDQTVNICGNYTYGSIACGTGFQSTITASPATTVRYDAVPPSPPTITSVSSLDSALSVRVSPPSDAVAVTVQVRAPGQTDFTDATTYDATSGGTTVNGLTNGVTYEVRAFVADEAGNNSAPSDVATGTPAPTSGFWAAYQEAGGKEQGGCSVAGPSAFGLVLFAAALWRARRVR